MIADDASHAAALARKRRGATRRAVLGAPLLAVVSRRACGAVPDAARVWVEALCRRADALGGPGLLTSYEVTPGGGVFDRMHEACAYVYDNAVAGIALLASGEPGRAARLGAALARAQETDRFWKDGRLRNAYRSGPAPGAGTYPLSGWWDGRWLEDPYQAGSGTGPVAWAILLWSGLDRAGVPGAWRAAAGRAADWLETQRAAEGYQGGTFGFEPHPVVLCWRSTEQNLDLAVAFARLNRAEAAAHAASFVTACFRPAENRFIIGLHPDGSPNAQDAVDGNLWPLLSPLARPEWRGALNAAMARHGVPAEAPAGVDFGGGREGIWLEGTAIALLALKRDGRREESERFAATLARHTAGTGLIYACNTPTLTTGLTIGGASDPPFLYYRRPALAPTGWAVLASLDRSPFA